MWSSCIEMPSKKPCSDPKKPNDFCEYLNSTCRRFAWVWTRFYPCSAPLPRILVQSALDTRDKPWSGGTVKHGETEHWDGEQKQRQQTLCSIDSIGNMFPPILSTQKPNFEPRMEAKPPNHVTLLSDSVKWWKNWGLSKMHASNSFWPITRPGDLRWLHIHRYLR